MFYRPYNGVELMVDAIIHQLLMFDLMNHPRKFHVTLSEWDQRYLN